MNDLPDQFNDKDSDRSESNSVSIREMNIDDIAPIFHLGEQLFTSDLYPYLYRTWDEWEVIGIIAAVLNS